MNGAEAWTWLRTTLGAPLAIVAVGITLMTYAALNGMVLVYMERKVSARMQRRMGPVEVGWAGTLQSLVDVIKLVSKQLITPRHVDKPLFLLAPLLAFMPVLAGMVLFPIGPTAQLYDFNVGLVLLFAFAGMSLFGVLMAGWGSNNKYALLGAMRAVAQNIAYEIPLLFSALSITLIAGSMQFGEIVQRQDIPYILLQPIGALIYLICIVAETNRAPFDIPEAESELVAGFHTEYSGMRFALFFLAEYTNMTIATMGAATLFLGGYRGPLLPPWLWFFAKVYLLLFLMMWFRWTFPRLRFDQLMTFAWKLLIPISIFNFLVTAAMVKVFQ